GRNTKQAVAAIIGIIRNADRGQNFTITYQTVLQARRNATVQKTANNGQCISILGVFGSAEGFYIPGHVQIGHLNIAITLHMAITQTLKLQYVIARWGWACGNVSKIFLYLS